MTDDIKDILVEKLLDAPKTLSPDEINAISRDEELRQLYEISAGLQNSLRPQPQTDMSKEWKSFRRRIVPARKRLQKRMMRIAAIFIGVTLLSGIAVRFIDNSPTSPQMIAKAACDTVISPPRTPKYIPPVDGTVKLAYVSDEIQTPHYVVQPTAPAEETVAKPIQVETDCATDTEEHMKILQARIDNDVAMAMAEVYEDEYFASLDADISLAIAGSELSGEEFEPAPVYVDEDINRVIML